MAYPYPTLDQVKRRIGEAECNRIFDDNEDGIADTLILEDIRADASAKIAGALRGIYDLDAVAADPPREVLRLSLDMCKVYAAQRHPEAVRFDWEPLLKSVDRDLAKIRTGEARLDVVGTPEPAANNGAMLIDISDEGTTQPRWGGRFGDF